MKDMLAANDTPESVLQPDMPEQLQPLLIGAWLVSQHLTRPCEG